MHQENEDIIVRLEQMNKRYIRKPECKKTLEDSIEIIKNLRNQIHDLHEYANRYDGFSPTYRG